MVSQPFRAAVVGIAALPYVNFRAGPGTNFDKAFQVDKGVGDLSVMAVSEDSEGKHLNGKVYQWFELIFPDDRRGWVRDDLIEIVGDGTHLGYDYLPTPTLAHNVARREVIGVGQESMSVAKPEGETVSSPPVDELDTVKKADDVKTEIERTEPTPTATGTMEKAGGGSEPLLVSAALNGSNARPAPGEDPVLFKLLYGEQARIISVGPGKAGDPFQWIQIEYKGQRGWVREDFQRLISGFEAFGLGYEDAYPSPLKNTWWVRDYNRDPNYAWGVHYGWDHGGETGEPVMVGPKGGTVIQTAFCEKCGQQGASVTSRGLKVGTASIFEDAGWNFGYGHYVIVRYLHEQLPASTQQQLAAMNFAGFHIFTIYAHLQSIEVNKAETLEPGRIVGRLGNSGNSEAPHLHLEIRAWNNPNETSWATMSGGVPNRPNILNPKVLFLR